MGSQARCILQWVQRSLAGLLIFYLELTSTNHIDEKLSLFVTLSD